MLSSLSFCWFSLVQAAKFRSRRFTQGADAAGRVLQHPDCACRGGLYGGVRENAATTSVTTTRMIFRIRIVVSQCAGLSRCDVMKERVTQWRLHHRAPESMTVPIYTSQGGLIGWVPHSPS